MIKLTSTEALCFFLLREKHKDRDSYWFHYLNVLPKSFDLPFLWTSEELNQLPITLQKKIKIQKSKVSQSYQKLKSIYETNPIIDETTPAEKNFSFSYEDFAWAWSVVNTRGAYKYHTIVEWLDASEKDNIVLVPLLDMFNHSTSVQVRVSECI